ncbi:hypothetical protein WR25_04261 [Diploscapter pachys]|uniref:RING-CH-type domain-containing protein n=1 Tax=Diploscapter pachys TaxID=2018661 RepID=A0A2A2K167_9BILA|nr:hypothetical protein WR25_04261 [Diploscapter pachys]
MSYSLEHINEEESLQSTSTSDSGSTKENEPLIEETLGQKCPDPEKSGNPKKFENRTTLWKGIEYCQSLSSISSSEDLCRICHSSSTTKNNPLISPCRCSGTLSFVHTKCLVKWLEMSSPKMSPDPLCELCCYKYKRGSIFKIRSIHFPHIEKLSIIMNALFFIAISIMILIGMALLGFIQENLVLRKRLISSSRSFHSPTLRWKQRGQPTVMVHSEYSDTWEQRIWPELAALFDIRIVVGFIFFLLSFFIALFTQYRAEHSIFKCFFRFFVANKNWTIRNYSIKDDPEMLAKQEEKKCRPNIGGSGPSGPGTDRSLDKRSLYADERLLPKPIMPPSCFL